MTIDELLRQIDDGSLPLTIVRAPAFQNYPLYQAAGWLLCVFDDAGGWDYIEWALRLSGGTGFVRHGEGSAIDAYHPRHLATWGYDPEGR